MALECMYGLDLYFWSQRVGARSLVEIEQVVMKWVWCDPKHFESNQNPQTDGQTDNKSTMNVHRCLCSHEEKV